MKKVFTKPPTSYQEQVQLLQQRGMLIADPKEAEFYLQHINYYRLGAYWLPFEISHAAHQFREGTSFEQVLALYIFDRELRLHLLDAIERIEVSVRAQWAYQLAHLHGAHAHLNVEFARSVNHWRSNFEKLSSEFKRSDEVFVAHLRNTYQEELPPVWAVSEIMTFGQLSRWYANLKPRAARRAIANSYQLDNEVLQSWLHHLAYIRNICAHHSRLWNREFTIIPMLPRNKPKYLRHQFQSGSRKIYNTLVMLLHLMDMIAPKHSWRAKLISLLNQSAIDLKTMGFPSNWEDREIWQ